MLQEWDNQSLTKETIKQIEPIMIVYLFSNFENIIELIKKQEIHTFYKFKLLI